MKSQENMQPGGLGVAVGRPGFLVASELPEVPEAPRAPRPHRIRTTHTPARLWPGQHESSQTEEP